MKIRISIIITLLISLYSFSNSSRAESAPERAKLEAILEKVAQEFAPDFQKNRWRLVTKIGWNKDDLNAHARVGSFSENKRVISINGEIMRRNLTEEAILWPICHELGHHFAGAPIYPDSMLSAEGQADYWAAQVCMPRLFKTQFSENNYPAPAHSIEYLFCETHFVSELERQACARTLRGGLEFHQALFTAIAPQLQKLATQPIEDLRPHDLRWFKKYNAPHPPLLTTPDSRKASFTRLDHPAHQCRVDTVLAGVLHQPRPACWYKATP
jgi:hypothetical protein